MVKLLNAGSASGQAREIDLIALLNLARNEKNRTDVSTFIKVELSAEEGVRGWRKKLIEKAGF